MHDLDQVPLMLLVEAKPGESPADALHFLEQYFDRRVHDTQFGPLYQIGPAYRADKRDYFQVQTFAGSLVWRVVSGAKKHAFDRAVIFKFSDDDGFQTKAPGVPVEPLRRASLRKVTRRR
jgi:hypothetical protein